MHSEISESAPLEHLRADPRTRRIALVAVGVMAVAGVVVMEWLLPRLLVLASTGQISRKSICIGFLVFLILFVIPVVVAGAQNRRLGRNAVQSMQFPCRETRVLFDIPIRRGALAVTLGKVQQLLGTFLIIAGIALLGVATFGVYTLW